jgi:hypothetical protein
MKKEKKRGTYPRPGGALAPVAPAGGGGVRVRVVRVVHVADRAGVGTSIAANDKMK